MVVCCCCCCCCCCRHFFGSLGRVSVEGSSLVLLHLSSPLDGERPNEMPIKQEVYVLGIRLSGHIITFH